MTVAGPVSADRLGQVMMHEHVLHGDVERPSLLEPLAGAAGTELLDAPVTIDILGTLWLASRQPPQRAADPARRHRARAAVAAGGRRADRRGGDVHGLAPGSRGLAGHRARERRVHRRRLRLFVDALLPDRFDELSVDQLAQELISDLRHGIGGSDVRAGVIGEVGTSPQITARERKSLRAAAIAAVETGAAVMVHLSHTVAPGAAARTATRPGFEALQVFTSQGLSADRVVFGHLDEACDADYAAALIAEGCVVGYDTFGTEWYWDHWQTWEPHDSQRVAEVAELCARGPHEQIVLSQDVAFKRHLRKFGGLGYGHLLTNIVPMLRASGVTDEALQAMLVTTPRRLLTMPGLATGGQAPQEA
jgi:phosphotriesterase-related protein